MTRSSTMNGGNGDGGNGSRQLQSTPIFFLFLASVCLAFLLASPPCSAQTSLVLDPKEVTALQLIAETLGKKDWNFNVDPCRWFPNTPLPPVKCNCTQNTYCHVTGISITQEGLAGTLPKELTELPFLTQFNVTDNYLSGPIPPEWGALRLVNLTLYGNRLSGPIPTQLGDMVTLQQLILEANQFSGEIPPHIGNLSNLEKLVLSSNNFTGELPQTLAKLARMSDFYSNISSFNNPTRPSMGTSLSGSHLVNRISSNGLSGKLPDFIGRWTQLQRLEIQGTNLAGPIPAGINKLENLVQLRISDIVGTSTNFPNLSRQTNLLFLILRNCKLFGEIPDYISEFKALRILDLSFNNLTGRIPNSLESIDRLMYLYLTNNSLSGRIPDWLQGTKVEADLSYNNFTDTNSDISNDCSGGRTNLVESFREVLKNEHIIHPCLRKNSPCNPQKPSHSSFHVKCGSSNSVNVNNTIFDGDTAIDGGAAFFVSPQGNWALTSTGTIMDNDDDSDVYTVSTNSTLSIPNPELYRTGRISPLSLKYYGLCLWNGPYTVRLYFSEIVITDDKNYTSLGRRIFDVYIQGKLVLKDFNIKETANGSNKAIVRTFSNLNVTNNVMEVHFFWAGKGSTGIPYGGTYGPLVSAISVESEFNPPKEGIDRKIVIVIVLSTVSLFLLIFLIIGILWKKGILMHKQDEIELRQLDLQTGFFFTLKQIKAATRNFNEANKIGEGGFGSVYKGRLSDGTIIAVKQLSSKSKQGSHEFITEIGMVSALQHPNLVKLFGCCTEGKQLLLVYEYMENNSLSIALSGPKEKRLKLNWPTRCKICIGIARGLAYLHEESALKIVHRDIKSTNVLLDKDLNAKISDFGLAKLHEDEKTHISTRVAGTYGYMAPEYAMRGHLTYKADVYSFGVVALEIVSGQSNVSFKHLGEGDCLLDWAWILHQTGNLLDLVDPALKSTYSKDEALTMINVALLCTNSSPLLRPKMSTVVSMLEGREPVPAPLPSPGVSTTHINSRMQRLADWQRSIQVQASSYSAETPWSRSYISCPAESESEPIVGESLCEIHPSP